MFQFLRAVVIAATVSSLAVPAHSAMAACGDGFHEVTVAMTTGQRIWAGTKGTAILGTGLALGFTVAMAGNMATIPVASYGWAGLGIAVAGLGIGAKFIYDAYRGTSTACMAGATGLNTGRFSATVDLTDSRGLVPSGGVGTRH